MRRSISAQSCDSVPPAPGWMVTMALRKSCSPPSIFLISPACTSFVQLVEPAAQLFANLLALLGPLHEHGQVAHAALQRGAQLDVLLETAAPLQDLLGLGLILPEVGGRRARFERGELIGRACNLKDSSADLRSAWRGPGNGGSDLRARMMTWNLRRSAELQRGFIEYRRRSVNAASSAASVTAQHR